MRLSLGVKRSHIIREGTARTGLSCHVPTCTCSEIINWQREGGHSNTYTTLYSKVTCMHAVVNIQSCSGQNCSQKFGQWSKPKGAY